MTLRLCLVGGKIFSNPKINSKWKYIFSSGWLHSKKYFQVFGCVLKMLWETGNDGEQQPMMMETNYDQRLMVVERGGHQINGWKLETENVRGGWLGGYQ